MVVVFFCDLHKYERMLKPKLCKDLLCCGTLKPYRYSPSRINIALGWFSLLISFVLINFHLNAFSDKIKEHLEFAESISDKVSFGLYIFIVSLFTTIITAWIISCRVKSAQSKSLCCRIWQWLKSLFSKPNDNQEQIKDNKKPRPIKIKIKSGIVNITPTKGVKNGI